MNRDMRRCVRDMRRYALLLDRDLSRADEQSNPEPIRYLAARQDEKPCKVSSEVFWFISDWKGW